MKVQVEFQGHTTESSADGSQGGSRDLHFSLHAAAEGGDGPLWSEAHASVPVRPNGAFTVVLGHVHPLGGELFADGPRWLAIHSVTDGHAGPELGPRRPVLGTEVRLASALDALEGRLSTIETHLADSAGAPVIRKARRRIVKLHQRLRLLERGEGPLAPLQSELGTLQARLERMDGTEGRVVRLEDELEDLTGPDGDIIDLLERVERLEGSGPVPRPSPPTAPGASFARTDPRFLANLAERVDTLTQRVETAEKKASAEISADSIHAVKRSGDVMTGGLVINRGGLDVLSGGIKCRGADVNTLEASISLKTPRLMADGIELRGDQTVDNTRRFLQVRHIEGRAGSARKDGPLELNARSGEAVAIGNAEQAAGLQVHGATTSGTFLPKAAGLAHGYEAPEPLEPGDIASVNAKGHAVRSGSAADRSVIGVVVAAAGFATGEQGEGRCLVAFGGVVRCRVTGEVHPGDLLVASGTAGRATRWSGEDRPPAGAVIGKALTSARGDAGEVQALISIH